MLRLVLILPLVILIGACNQDTNKKPIDINKEAVDTYKEPVDTFKEPVDTNKMPVDNNKPNNPSTTANGSASKNSGDQEITSAVTKLEAIGDSGVGGTITWTKEGDKVHIEGKVTGLKPGEHGFHVHEKGDLSDKKEGKSAGGHYNPTDQPHGRLTDAKRHVGDMGNITADKDGVAKVEITDAEIKLNGKYSVIGRALVIHGDADKFTQPSGDAGPRVAFGLIEASPAAKK